MGDTCSVCCWLSGIIPFKRFPSYLPDWEIFSFCYQICVCSNVHVFDTRGSKKTFRCVSSDHTLRGKHLYHPSAASQEAQPSYIRFYYLFIKTIQQKKTEHLNSSTQNPQAQHSILNICFDFIPNIIALHLNHWHIITTFSL